MSNRRFEMYQRMRDPPGELSVHTGSIKIIMEPDPSHPEVTDPNEQARGLSLES